MFVQKKLLSISQIFSIESPESIILNYKLDCDNFLIEFEKTFILNFSNVSIPYRFMSRSLQKKLSPLIDNVRKVVNTFVLKNFETLKKLNPKINEDFNLMNELITIHMDTYFALNDLCLSKYKTIPADHFFTKEILHMIPITPFFTQRESALINGEDSTIEKPYLETNTHDFLFSNHQDRFKSNYKYIQKKDFGKGSQSRARIVMVREKDTPRFSLYANKKVYLNNFYDLFSSYNECRFHELFSNKKPAHILTPFWFMQFYGKPNIKRPFSIISEILPTQVQNITDSMILPLIDTLNFLHENGIIYNDFKTSNFRLDSKGNIKLFDFGHSFTKKIHDPYIIGGTFSPPECLDIRASKKSLDELEVEYEYYEFDGRPGYFPAFYGIDSWAFGVSLLDSMDNRSLPMSWDYYGIKSLKENHPELAPQQYLDQFIQFINRHPGLDEFFKTHFVTLVNSYVSKFFFNTMSEKDGYFFIEALTRDLYTTLDSKNVANHYMIEGKKYELSDFTYNVFLKKSVTTWVTMAHTYLDTTLATNKDPSIEIKLRAIKQCLDEDPRKRPSMKELELLFKEYKLKKDELIVAGFLR